MYLTHISIVLLFGISLAQGAATSNENQSSVATALQSSTRLTTRATDVTDRTAYPYQASLQLVANNQHICSASLIDKEHLLTSAYCVHEAATKDSEKDYVVREAETLQVVLGILTLDATENKLTRTVKYIFVSEDWSPRTPSNDIAVLRVEEEIATNTVVNTIGLATSSPAAGTTCTSSAWEYSETTLVTNLKEATFATVACSTGATNDDQFCANVINACPSEAGSPIICNEQQVGIALPSTCTSDAGPVTDVFTYTEWIKEQQKRSGSSNLMNSVYLISSCIFAWMYTYKNF